MADIGLAFLAPMAEVQRMEQSEALAPLKQAAAVQELENSKAVARLNTASASSLEAKAAVERRAADLMAQTFGKIPSPGDSPPSVSTMLLGQAHIYGAAGSPAKAAEFLVESSRARATETAAKTADSMAEARDHAGRTARLKEGIEMLDGVVDADSWAVIQRMAKEEFGDKAPKFFSAPYDPKFVEVLKGTAMTAYQRAQLEHRDKELAARKELAEDRERRKVVAASVATTRRATEADLRRRNKKEGGGKGVGMPPPGMVAAAKRLLSSQANLVSAEDLPTAAFDVASRAMVLRAANSGLAPDEAIRQAITAKRANNDFEPGEESNFLGLGGKKPTYGVTESLPPSGNPTDLEVGKRYKNSAGVVKVWGGPKGWLDGKGGK